MLQRMQTKDHKTSQNEEDSKEPNFYLVLINDISKFIKSRKHNAVMKEAMGAAKVMKDAKVEDILYLIP